MNKVSQLKQEYADQVAKAPWLAWAVPIIGCLCLIYLMLGFRSIVAGYEAELRAHKGRLAQLQSISADTEWSHRADGISTMLNEWKSQIDVMQSKTLTQAEILTRIQAIGKAVNLEQLDVVVGEPIPDRTNPQYVRFDINIRLGNVNGFVFEEFWSRLLSEQAFLSVTMIDVMHRRNILQGRMSAQILVVVESGA